MRIIIYISALVALSSVATEENADNILASANQQFTAKMFSEVTKINPGKSVVLSAFSVLTPLAQLALASEGLSHDEILQTMGLPNDNVTKEAFTNLNRHLRDVKGVDLKMANRVYVKEQAELNDQYGEVLRAVFGSDFKNIDFAQSVQAAAEINTWVEEQTNNLIKDLLKPDSLNAATAAILVNAIYFKGTWKHAFAEEATKDLDFHISKDKTVKVPTMYLSENLKYGESEELDAKLLELPYEGEESSLLVILPNEIDGLAALEEKLQDKEAVDKAVAAMYYYEVDVLLPKFKIETEINLKDVLENMGIKKLFTPEAQLNKLFKGSSGNLAVSEAIQKAYIEISEKGTKAAASNAFGVTYLSAYVPMTKRFTANHPFVFMLYERNNPIFTGVYQN